MADSIYSSLEMFITRGTIMSGRAKIPHETLLSRDEMIRRGLTSDYINRLAASGTVRRASPAEIAEYKKRVGITAEVEAAYSDELERERREYAAALERVNGDPHDAAAELVNALDKWRSLESEYLQHDRNLGEGDPVWINQVRTGFELDRLRARFQPLEDYIRKLLEPVKRGIVPLTGIHATPLQRFVASMHPHGQTPNADWIDAKMLAEMLPLKLEHHANQQPTAPTPIFIEGQRRPLEVEEPKQPLWKRVGWKVWAGIGALLLAVLGLFGNHLWETYGKEKYGNPTTQWIGERDPFNEKSATPPAREP